MVLQHAVAGEAATLRDLQDEAGIDRLSIGEAVERQGLVEIHIEAAGNAKYKFTCLEGVGTLFYKGHVRAVLPDYTTYVWEEWCDIPVQPDDDFITTPNMVLRIPRVIQLLSCERQPHAEVKFSRLNIYMRDGNRCQYCGRRHSTSELSLDHVVPISRGGPSSWENVVCACLPCNVRKGNRLPEEAGLRLRRPPVKPKATPLGLLSHLRIHPTWKNFLDVAYWIVELK